MSQNVGPMKAVTISLPSDIALELSREAARRSVSESEVVRSALVSAFAGPDAFARRALPFPALGNSGSNDISAHTESILGSEWGELLP